MALPAPAVNALPSPARRGKNTAMSKSLKRVRAALEAGGVAPDILEMAEGTRTAADAARAAGCEIDQIAKSIIFRGESSGRQSGLCR